MTVPYTEPDPLPQPSVIQLGQRWQNKCHGTRPSCDGVVVRHFGGTLWEFAHEVWPGRLEFHTTVCDLVGIVSEEFLRDRCIYVGECDWFLRALGACTDPTHTSCQVEARIARDCWLSKLAEVP